METKKAWELFLRAYPYFQAFALPRFKDKQHKPAHAEWYYMMNIIHPRRRFVALPLWNESNLRSLKVQTVTFWKRLFSLQPYPRTSSARRKEWLLSRRIPLRLFGPPCHERLAWSVQSYENYEYNKNFWKEMLQNKIKNILHSTPIPTNLMRGNPMHGSGVFSYNNLFNIIFILPIHSYILLASIYYTAD